MSTNSTEQPRPDSPPSESQTRARILILGKSGQIGGELERVFAGFGSVVAVGRESVD